MSSQSSEFNLHTAIISWLNLLLPADSVVHHSPNEGQHKVQYRAKQKRLGVQAGWPDIEVFVPPKHFHRPLLGWAPIFLEVKSAKGRVSTAQKETMDRLSKTGAHVTVVRSIDDVAAYLGELLTLRGH